MVTAAPCARSLPLTTTPEEEEIAVRASTLPSTCALVLRVADEPTCHSTLSALPTPSLNTTLLCALKVMAEPIWKVHWASESPPASSVSTAFALTEAAAAYLYTPGGSTIPPRSAVSGVLGRRATLSNAVFMSA
eukprot:CAMPEP_0173178048 /NCGR_PEP_ID=MMETSP1141-20130122/5315_1 /TAXON_ID=483371 /ORGANISM="non described non described, Strain CCMP2298" /LENGTH=133 /DNA_ID=CAMNT_0014100487 /DNA_START=377 /DNA_END=778 /DNA_ORIENTATION=-